MALQDILGALLGAIPSGPTNTAGPGMMVGPTPMGTPTSGPNEMQEDTVGRILQSMADMAAQQRAIQAQQQEAQAPAPQQMAKATAEGKPTKVAPTVTRQQSEPKPQPAPQPSPQPTMAAPMQTQMLGAPAPTPQQAQQPVQMNPGNTYGYKSVAPQSMEALMGPAPQAQPQQKQGFLGNLGGAISGALPQLLQAFALNEAARPRGGVKDWQTGLTFGASAPGSSPAYQMMVQNIQNQQAQQQAEAKLQQDMAMEEFKTMMAIEEESAKKYGEMGVQQAKDASKFMMDMLNSNLLDVTKVNPQVLERIQAGDLEAMAEARSWLKPGVEDQLKEMAMGAYQNYLADPTYEPTEDELNLFSILGVARSPSSAYARDTQYGSQALAHQYATERQGRSLANQMTMANYRAAKKMTDADAKAVASATPAKPVYRKLGGIDYMIMGEGNPVTVFDGVSPNGTQISWEEFTGTGAPVEVPAEVPAEEPGFWDKVGSTIGGWLGRGNDEPVTDEDYLRELEALGIR